MSVTFSRVQLRKRFNGVTPAEIAFIDGVTAGTALASKALVLNASKGISTITTATITTLTSTTVNTTTANATTVNAGADASAGTLNSFPSSTASGKFIVAAVNSAGAFNATLSNASLGQSTVFSLPDPGAATTNVVLSNDALSYRVDGVNMSPLKYVDVTVASTDLGTAGTKNVVAAVAGDAYKVRNIRLVGGGTSFSAGGDRLIGLTDGTTTWTTIANADVESAPSATLDWGNAKVPFLTGTSDTASVTGQAIRFVYSGGTTDHTTGSIKFSVCLEKIV